MTYLSCVAIGVAFLLALGLLLFAAVLLGWYVPAMIERARRGGGSPAPIPPRDPGAPRGGPDAMDPPGDGS